MEEMHTMEEVHTMEEMHSNVEVHPAEQFRQVTGLLLFGCCTEPEGTRSILLQNKRTHVLQP